MSALNESRLDEQLGELEKLRAWSPRVISKLESFLRTEDGWALFRANPFYFAEERGVSPDEAIDLFLLAGKVGLLRMTWSLLCPGCGAAVQSFSSLRKVCAMFHCVLCSTDMETKLDDFVQVGFTIYITDEIYRAPGVGELLQDLHVTAQQASLKGVQRSVSVYRVASGPSSLAPPAA